MCLKLYLPLVLVFLIYSNKDYLYDILSRLYREKKIRGEQCKLFHWKWWLLNIMLVK